MTIFEKADKIFENRKVKEETNENKMIVPEESKIKEIFNKLKKFIKILVKRN